MKPIQKMGFKWGVALLLAALLQNEGRVWAASGPSNGGGGDVVILPNDDIVLADPFLRSDGPQPNNMPPLRALNPRILQLVGLYLTTVRPILVDLSPQSSSAIAIEMEKLTTRRNDLRFYAVQNVTELNTFCAPGGKKNYHLPPGYGVQQVACTAGNETFLVEPLFIRLSLRDQVLLLIHERLTTLRDQYGGKNYSAIARFTTGLATYLETYRAEALGNYPVLSPADASKLTEFYTAAEEIEYRDQDPTADSFQWVAHVHGGGRVHRQSRVDESAIVALNALVPRGGIVGRDARLIDFKVTPPTGIRMEIGEAASLRDISITGLNPESTLQVQPRAHVEKLSLIANQSWRSLIDVTIGESATVQGLTAWNFRDQANGIEIGSGARVENVQVQGSGGSTIHLVASSQAALKNLKVEAASIEAPISNAGGYYYRPSIDADYAIQIGEKANLVDSTLSSASVSIGAGSVLRNMTLSSYGTPGKIELGEGSRLTRSKIMVNGKEGPIEFGSNQTLTDGKVSSETIATFLPEGIQVLPVGLEKSLSFAAFDLSEYLTDGDSEADVLKAIRKCSKTPELVISAAVSENFVFLSHDTFTVKSAGASLHVQPIKNQDPQNYTVSQGQIKQAGFSRFGQIEFSRASGLCTEFDDGTSFLHSLAQALPGSETFPLETSTVIRFPFPLP